MRAVVVEHPGGPEALTLVDVPRPNAGEGEVVVEVEAVGVNPVDLGNRADPSWAGISPPYVVGYELAGLGRRDRRAGVGAAAGAGDDAGGARRAGRRTPCSYVAPATARARPDRRGRAAAGRLYGAPGAAADAAGGRVVGARPRRDRRGRAPPGPDGARARAARRGRRRGPRNGAGSRSSAWTSGSTGPSPVPAAAAARELGHELDAVVDLVGGQLEPSLPHVRVGGHAATIVDLTGDLDLAIDRNIDLHGVLMRAGPRPALRARAPRSPPASARTSPTPTRSSASPTPTAASRPAASAASW